MSAHSEIPPELPKEGTPLFRASDDLKRYRLVLDPFFESLGFTPDDQSFTLATYKGELAGRGVKVCCTVRTRQQWISPDVRYRRYAGLSFEFILNTPLKTRLAISPPIRSAAYNFVTQGFSKILGLIARMRFGMKKLSKPPTDYNSFSILTVDPAWTQDFLGDSSVRNILDGLLPERDETTHDPTNNWSLRFTPETMWLLATPTSENITPEALEKLLNAAVELVQLAETKPTHVTCELTHYEISAQKNPGAAAIKTVLLVIFIPVLALFFLCCLFLVAGLIWGPVVLIVPIVFLIFFMPYAMFLVFRNWFSAAKSKKKASSKRSAPKVAAETRLPPPLPKTATESGPSPTGTGPPPLNKKT